MMHHDPLSTFVPSVCDPVSSLWRRVRRGTRLLRRLPVWDRFAGEDWPDRVMSEAVTDRLHEKQGRSIGRRVFDHDGETLSVYLKRHYRLPRLYGVLATLFPDSAWSPGLQEWQHLAWAKEQGFPVPRAVAAGQFVGPWGRLKGFLVVEELHDMLPLHEAVPLAFQRLDAVTFANWKRGLIGELARLARELHRRRAFHKDLYFCHFYIAEADTRRVPESWTNRAVMIDLHRLARHRLTATWWLVKDLAQFLYSSDVPGVTPRDRARFWKLYRQGWPGKPPGEWLTRFIRAKADIYHRNHRRRHPE